MKNHDVISLDPPYFNRTKTVETVLPGRISEDAFTATYFAPVEDRFGAWRVLQDK